MKLKWVLIIVLAVFSFRVFSLPLCERTKEAGQLFSEAEAVEPIDMKKSLMFYKKSANEGHAIAAHHLGLLYVSGRGVMKDYDKAYTWFEKAARLGQHNSMFSLGIMNKNGEGRSINLPLAYAWYSLAGDYIPKNWDEWHMPRSKVAMYKRADSNTAKLMTQQEVEKGKKLKNQFGQAIKCSWYVS